MRVLHVVECYEAGVGRAVDTMVSATPEFEHHLLYAGSQVPPPELWTTVEHLPPGARSRVGAVRRRIATVHPDVVHAHSSWAGVYTRVLRRRSPLVYQPHCFGFVDPALARWQRLARRTAESVLARRTSVLAVVSESEATIAHRLAPGVEVAVLPNAPTMQVRATTGGAAPGRQVAMAGRVSPQKCPDLFAAVARECRARGVDADFVWLGDGDAPARARLEDAGVRVTGWLSVDDVRAELDRTAVYLHTARYEGFPVSVLDAAARGVPLVVRAIPAFAGSGLPVVPDSALVSRVSAVLDDPAERSAALAAGGRLLARMNGAVLASAVRSVYGALAPTRVLAA
jgi:glycosyltransferase involved in cell wall biosynthesis